MEKTEQIWFDGGLVPWDQAQVHVLTHTLHYGLGVFEGIRCYDGEAHGPLIFRLPEHVDRLLSSAHIMGMKIGYSKHQLIEACVETVAVNKLRSCYIRPLAFLGDGEMGLAANNAVRVIIAAWPWGAYLGDEGIRRGVRLKTASVLRPHVNTYMTKAKTVGNYVNSILASQEAKRAGCDEAMLLDTEGFVAECSGENIFLVKDGRVKTTPPTSILPGITRATVMALLQSEGVEVSEQRFTRDEAYLADEVFMTGTAAEVTPVREIDGRQIGSGEPGPITKAVQARYARVVRGAEDDHRHWCTPVG